MARVLVMHNPNSGYAQPGRDEILGALREAGHTPAYQSVKVDDFACALDDPGDLVAVVGGDGTVTKVAKLLAGRGVPIALLPVGTANNLAKALGHTGALADLIARWNLDARRDFDLGLAQGDWGRARFMESFGVGLMAKKMVKDAESKEGKNGKRGEPAVDTATSKLRDDLTSLRKIVRSMRARCVKVQVGDEDLSGDYLLVEVTNIRHMGPNLPLAEHASPSDGKIEVVLLPEEERETFAEYLKQRLEGNPAARSGLTVRQTDRVAMSWAKLPAQFDGTPLPLGDRDAADVRTVEIEVLPRALQFLDLEP